MVAAALRADRGHNRVSGCPEANFRTKQVFRKGHGGVVYGFSRNVGVALRETCVNRMASLLEAA